MIIQFLTDPPILQTRQPGDSIQHTAYMLLCTKNDTKYSNTKLPWSSLLLRHSAGKW